MTMINNSNIIRSTGNMLNENIVTIGDNNNEQTSTNQSTIQSLNQTPNKSVSQNNVSRFNIDSKSRKHLTSLSSSSILSTPTSTSSRLSRKKAKKQKNSLSNLSLNNYCTNNSPNEMNNQINEIILGSATATTVENQQLTENVLNENINSNESTLGLHNNNLNDHLVHHQHLNEMSTYDSMAIAHPQNIEISNETQGITKRSVIIHKDSRGYGMRISGDSPVIIQSVNEEGAAYKAGVRSGDQIIKVNGTLVTRLGHTEVVRKIQSCGSFVGLTLLSSTSSITPVNTNTIISSSSPATSPTPPIQTTSTMPSSLGPSLTPSTANTALSNFQQMYSMNSMILNNNNNNLIRITGPQPVPESTQQQFLNIQIQTLQNYISKKLQELEELKLMRAPQQELDRCQKIIDDMTTKLEMHKMNISSSNTVGSHSRQHSFETNTNEQQTLPRIMPMDDDVDLDTDIAQSYEYIDDMELERDINNSLKSLSKSANSYIVRTGTSARDKTKRDSNLSSIFETISPISGSDSLSSSIFNTKAWFNLHLDSLRICKYLIIQKLVPPNQLLFYVMAKTVFPKIVTNCPITPATHKSQVIQRWAYQIIATFITRDSPLFIKEFPSDCLETFERNLTALISANPSATDIVPSPFEPFLKSIYEIVHKQWQEFMLYMHRQRSQTNQSGSSSTMSSWLQTNPKHDLISIIETLLTAQSSINNGNNIQAKLDLRDIDSILDTFVQLVKLNQAESTMAMISSLLAIGRYIFNITTSRHCLLLECGSSGSSAIIAGSSTISSPLTAIQLNTISVSSSLNPILKLSSESTSHTKKSGHKRNSMIPIGSKSFSVTSHTLSNSFDSSSLPQNAGTFLEDRSHTFVSIVEMNTITYCTSCLLPLWGDPYTLKCTKCLMHAHLWCRKTAAANNICNDVQNQQFLSQSGKQSNIGQRRVKSEKKSVFEKITGKKVSKRNNDFINNNETTLTRTSSISSSSSDSISSLDKSTSDCEDGDNHYKKEIESYCATSANSAPVNRSGSFVQRKKKKSSISIESPRKRSDPALTSKQISTMSGNSMIISSSCNTGPLPQLTSARSSGALMNSASVGAHDSQFRPITGQRAKHMTASDSSLISTISASKMKPSTATAGSSTMTNMFSNNESNKSSSTNLTSTSSPRRTRHRNTNDSAIQMDASSEDDLNDLDPGQTEQLTNEMLNEENGGNEKMSSIPPPLPPRHTSDSHLEKRRQIQMEIVQTEEEHLEVLRYLRTVYQKPLKKENFFTHEQIDIIFGNIKELKSIHRKISSRLKAAYNKITMHSSGSDIYYLEEAIHDIFCGELGAQLETETSRFCVNRKIRNGTELWNQRKKDAGLRALVDAKIRSRSMPDNPLARLGLDDLLSRVFQRPLRYPLLFDRLLRSVPKDSSGYRYLDQVLISLKKSHERINETTEKAELRARLLELIRKTDFSNFTNSSLIENLEQHELLHEGSVMWRITKQKLVDVLLIVTNQIMLVLTRDSGDRYVLRSHSNPTMKHDHRPDIKMDDLLIRDVATDHSAFFLVSKNQDIIYEFAASSSVERNKWKDVINKAIIDYRANHPSLLLPHQLQTQKSFTSNRSLTMSDLKTSSSANDIDNASSTLLPPSIINRPLPKLPLETTSPLPPPPPPPPLPPPSFINRPLPKLPVELNSNLSVQPLILPKYELQYAPERECYSTNHELVPFSCVKVHNNSSNLKENGDNMQNLAQEQRSNSRKCQELEREIQEMSMVYDVAKHDTDSKDTLSRLITEMFRKATEWSYHFVKENESAKEELSQRVRNSVESFLKSHIDSNFILPLPGDVEQAEECPPDSTIIPLTSTKLCSESLLSKKEIQFEVLSDKSNVSNKSQELGHESSNDLIFTNENISNAEQSLGRQDSLSTLNPFDETSSTMKSQENFKPNPFQVDSDNNFIITNIVNLNLNDTNENEFCNIAKEISDNNNDNGNNNNNDNVVQLENDNKQFNNEECYLNDENMEINSATSNLGEISATTKSSTSTITTTTTTSQTYLI